MAKYPSYEAPPVAEVSIGIQFAPIRNFSNSHVGLYWSTIQSEFPRTDALPPVLHIVEPPDVAVSQQPAALAVMPPLPFPRTLFVDASDTRLVQLQADRFIYNWRRGPQAPRYPRFEPIMKEFFIRWEGFCEFLEKQSLGLPQTDQCEVTYFNHIPLHQGWHSMREALELFTVTRWNPRFEFLPSPESLRWALTFRLPESQGHLHVELLPAFQSGENEPMLLVSLTARGAPPNTAGRESLESWYRLAREWIVKAFADLADSKTDPLWGKTS